jgi:putative transcriptional regulator
MPPSDNDVTKPAAGKYVAAVSALRAGVALIASFAIGLMGGYAAKLLHFPLPYMTGALLSTAGLVLAGVPVRSVWQARAAGQFVTGSAIGTSFTPTVLVTILTLLPMIVLGAVVSIGFGAVGALILMRLVKVDSRKPLEPLRTMTDAEVMAAALADPDAKPLTPEDFKRMKRIPRAKIIRRALGLTQEEFAARFRIPLGTLRDWEQGAAEPDQAARAYLTVIARNPKAVADALIP